ncbi:hypothetical protein DBR06_SOUSAS17710039, partial [Sousa chinensis]
LARDLLHSSLEEEEKKQKKKWLVQSPNSYFMDGKCPGCCRIARVCSHSHVVMLCVGCSTELCQLMGGKARLTEGCSCRKSNTNDPHNFLNLGGIAESLIGCVILVNLSR